MRTLETVVVGIVSLSMLIGCGGDPPGPAPSGGQGLPGGPGAPSGPGGEPPAAALVGKPLGGAGQLVGTWSATTDDGDFSCLEVTREGKAIVGDGSHGVTVDCSVLEGGRLSLVMPGGATTVFQATISGDQLELKGGRTILSSGGPQRFRRLKAGETCADAQKALARAKAEAYQRRVASLETFLKQPGLVLAFAEPALASIALEVQSSAGRFSGKAWHDDQPPHLNGISGELQLNQAANLAQIVVTYGQRIAPPASQPDGGGQITMTVEGEGKDLRIAAKVTFGGGGPSHELVLRSQPELHAAIVKRYEAELARIEALKQPMVALLKDFAALRGELQPMDPRSAEPDTMDLALARDPRSGLYSCEGVAIGARGRGELIAQAAAAIVIVNDKPLLRLVCPPSRECLLGLPDPKTPKLAGQWMAPGSNQGKGARFDVVEALDAAARDARFDTRRQAIKALGEGAVLTGLAFEDSGFGLEMPIACRLQLSVKPDGSAAGKADYPSLMTLATVAGQLRESPFGPRLELTYSAAEATPGDKIFFRSIQGGMWRLLPVEGAQPAQLAGYFTGPPVRPATLTLVQEESTAQVRKKLSAILGNGERLYVSKFVGWQVPGQTPTVLEWKLDEASGKVTGQMAANGRALGTSEKLLASYEGEVKPENGWITLEMFQITPYHAYDRAVSALKLLAAPDRAGVLHLNGLIVGMGTVPNDKPIPAFPKVFDRQIDLIPVAATDSATHAAIDKAIADVQKAKADAGAAATAAQAAALDARRGKLAPFFPFFRAKTGLVITTDAPMELGTVILESQVDEAKAAIAGKGLDLRELPFREFTFESGLDNWGNLTVTTSLSKTPYAFAAPKENVAAGRGMALKLLSDADRAKLDTLIALGRRLQSAPQALLTVEVLAPAAAKARETGLAAGAMPGVAIYRNAKNDQVAAMFTPQSNGRYRWSKEPVTHRLLEPMKGKAIYIKNGAPTDNLTVIINGVHRATIPAIAQMGAASIALPADLEILDLRLQADGTAQARGVVLLK